MRFPSIRGIFLVIPIVRTLVYLGNYRMQTTLGKWDTAWIFEGSTF